jgi:ribosome-binding protein aMBF1 (putative translation factor)
MSERTALPFDDWRTCNVTRKPNPHRGHDALAHIRELHERSPELQAEYERLRPRYEVVKQLILARRRARLSQRDLAQRLGVSPSVIGRLESAEHSPRLETVVDVAGALGYRLDVKLVRKKTAANG